MCPVSWSAGEGDGMEADAGAAVRAGISVGAGKSKRGVVKGPVAAGDANEEGVEACSVANRFGVGVEATGMLHAASSRANRRRRKTVEKSLILFMIQFDGFKIEFFARYYFCAITAALGTMDLFIPRMIFREAGHALNFCIQRTEMKLRLFRRRAFAELIPMFSDPALIEFGDLADHQIETLDTCCLCSARLYEGLIQNVLYSLKLAHDPQCFTKVGRIPENKGAAGAEGPAPLFSGFSCSFRNLPLILNKNTSGRFISRILSMAPGRHWAIISLGDASPRRSVRPTRDWLSHRMRKHV